jgi:hypothetical protein
MATLASTGSTKVNENNPYQQALANAQAQTTPQAQVAGDLNKVGNFARSLPSQAQSVYQGAVSGTDSLYQSGVSAFDKYFLGDNQSSDNSYTPAKLGPASESYLKNTKAGRTSTAAEIEAGKNLPTTAAASVADTPEAMSPEAAAAEQQAANAKQIAVDQKSKSGYGKLIAPTRQAEVNAALAPDQALLSSLPAEYQKTLSQLAPYAHLGENTSDPALNAADATVNAAVGQSNNIMEAALAQLPKDSREYAKSITTQPIVQALLGFGKYEQTYAGAQPQGQSEWSKSMDEVYKYLSGSSASSNGLGSPQTAANAASASTVPGNTGAGGGNG